MRKVNCKGKRKIRLSHRTVLAQEQRKDRNCSGIALSWRTQIPDILEQPFGWGSVAVKPSSKIQCDKFYEKLR